MLVSHYGRVYRLTKRQYRCLLYKIANDEPWNLFDIGAKDLGAFESITDLDAAEAQYELDQMKEDK